MVVVPIKSMRLTVSTFNILAPCYLRLRKRQTDELSAQLESGVPERFLKRNVGIVEFLRSINSDVICLQEFWFGGGIPRIFEEGFKDSHRLITLQRTGCKEDGIAFLVARKLEILDVHHITFDDAGDRVASLLLIQQTQKNGTHQYLLGNTHLTFPHGPFDAWLRVQQIKLFMDSIEAYQNRHHLTSVPVILAGDYNGDETDPVYAHLSMRGYSSSALKVLGREAAVTHHNHCNNDVGVDFLFFKAPLNNMRPTAWRIFPENVSDTTWPSPESFNLSDHRPVEAIFELFDSATD